MILCFFSPSALIVSWAWTFRSLSFYCLGVVQRGKKIASNFETVLPKFREIAHKKEPTLDANAELTLHEYSMELEFGQLWKRSRHI